MKQEQVIVHEAHKPYEKNSGTIQVAAFAASRTQWVENILTGSTEQSSKVSYSSPSSLILPDMKWGLKTISSLYLLSIVRDRTIRRMRDLRKQHIGLLKDIRPEAAWIVSEKWGWKRFPEDVCALSAQVGIHDPSAGAGSKRGPWNP